MIVRRFNAVLAAMVLPPQPDAICSACWANLATAHGILMHNIHTATYGERSYPAPQSVYVTRLPARL